MFAACCKTRSSFFLLAIELSLLARLSFINYLHRPFSLECEDFGPLGIGNGDIKESQLSVSSLHKAVYHRDGQGPYRAGIAKQQYWAPAALVLHRMTVNNTFKLISGHLKT